MSREDDFSISDLRRKREAAQAEAVAAQASSGHAGHHHTPIQTTPVVQTQPRVSAPPIERGGDEDDEHSEWSVDTGRMLAALKRHWLWLVIGAVVVGALGAGAGYYKGKYSASITLIRRAVGGGTDTFKQEELSPETLKSLLQSADLKRIVAAKANPPVAPDRLSADVSISAEKNTELVSVTIQNQNAAALVDLVNLYATEAVSFTRDLQLGPTRQANKFYKEKAAKLDEEIQRANSNLLAFLSANNITDPKVESENYLKQLAETGAQIRIKGMEAEFAALEIPTLQEDLARQSPLSDQLAAAKLRLDSLLVNFREQHPTVQGVQAEIAMLEGKIAAARTNQDSKRPFPAGSYGNTLQTRIAERKERTNRLGLEIQRLEKNRDEFQRTVAGLTDKGREYARLKAELNSLETQREKIAVGQSTAQHYEDSAEGYFRIFNPITKVDVETRPRFKKAVSFGFKGALAGLALAAALVLLVELKDRTLKTVAEVERITGLRVLAALGDLDKMTAEERDRWAFRAWTVMAGQLNASPNHGMVCGFVSSGRGEGRSTWIKLLGNAASQRGLRVLTVATKPSGSDEPATEPETAANEKSFTDAVDHAMTEVKREAEVEVDAVSGEGEFHTEMLSPNSLAFPAEVTKKFIAGEMPSAHIPLPGWVWNLDRRRQWQMALAHWRTIDNLVLLVELPPASVPESVLLAESLPQLIWLVDSGKAGISGTKEQLEMMRHAKCQIVGAVLNHEPEPIIKL